MASGPHAFLHGNVFTAERFQGDHWVLISVRADQLSLERKHQYARGFGCATAFLHDALPGQPRRIEMFNPVRGELSFCPTLLIGIALYIFYQLERRPEILVAKNYSTLYLRTKYLGDLEFRFNENRLVGYAIIPHNNFRVLCQLHLSTSQILDFQPQLQLSPSFAELPHFFPIAALFPGQEIPLVNLSSSPELLSLLSIDHIPPPTTWQSKPRTCIFYVLECSETFTDSNEPNPTSSSEPPYPPNINTSPDSSPIIIHSLLIRGLGLDRTEELASGTGACTLGAYIALQLGGPKAHHVFNFNQITNHPLPPSCSTPSTCHTPYQKPASQQTTNPSTTSPSPTPTPTTRQTRSQICVDVQLDTTGTKISELAISGRGTIWAKGDLSTMF